MYSNRINIPDIFSKIDYIAILRMSPEFPSYKARSDIDVLCSPGGYAIDDLIRLLPLTRINKSPTQVQLDYVVDGKLDLKFDLYTRVISEQFTHDLFMSSVTKMIDGYPYYVPSDDFNGMLKCYEFVKQPIRKNKYADFVKYKPLLYSYL